MSATPLVSQLNSPLTEKSALIPPLLGASVEELTAWVQQQGQPAYRGKQLHDWIYHKGVKSLADISVFPKNWRLEVADVPIGRSTIHYRSVANDGTVKYLLQLADGQVVEAVGIPSD
ncbi:MAG TPA: 23S rRNA (adenine(2503)-C(2))-methyltransferase RlmN, partial [Nostocaceae cyanobacterium]|nr:23S rRNA (adenine(2503)-C(2))-methyltransferase RlmN [Nostocaceae cyanobacterium]